MLVAFVASAFQHIMMPYDGNTLREETSYRLEGNGGILYTLRNGTPSYTHESRRGDVIAKTDGSGSLTYQATYEAFGKRTQEHGSTLDRQKANTKDEDPTGLLNEGFRYRDLDTGTFISRDPLGFVDGPNIYAYVVCNPWSKFDPEGLNEVIVSAGINTQINGSGHSSFVTSALRHLGVSSVAHDRNPMNFIAAAEHQITERQKAGDKQSIEWMVQKSSYENRALTEGKSKDFYTSQIDKFAKDHGVDLRYYNDKKELINSINTNTSGKPRQGDEKISSYDQFGHGYPGKMSTDFNHGSSEPNNITPSDISSVSKDAFQANSKSNLYPCNSAAQTQGTSVKDAWQNQTGSETRGVDGRMDYAPNPETPAPTAAGAKWVPNAPAQAATPPPKTEEKKKDQ